jgi:hypothetical protein
MGIDVHRFQCRSDFWISMADITPHLWIYWLSGLTKIVLTIRKLNGFVTAKILCAALYCFFSAIALLIFSPSRESGPRISSTTDSEEKFSTRADDLRVSTASGSERGFRKGLIDGASLATARGADASARVEKFGG